LAYASRQSSYLVSGVGAFLQVVAAWWSMFSRLRFGGVSPTWNLANLTLYSALAITLFGVWRGLHVNHEEYASFMNIQFINLSGLKLVGIGCVIEVIACAMNAAASGIVGGRAVSEPAQALLTIGMLTVNLGVAIGLTIEYGVMRRDFIVASASKRAAVVFLILVTFSAIWLAASGALIYLAIRIPLPLVNWGAAFSLSLFGTFVLIPLKRVMPQIGSGVGVGIIFNTVAYFFLVTYAGRPAYVPWGLLPVFLFEIMFFLLGPKAGLKVAALLASPLTGVLFGAMYYPLTLNIFPWSFSAQPAILAPVVGSAIGALLGYRVYTSLSSAVVGKVTASL